MSDDIYERGWFVTAIVDGVKVDGSVVVLSGTSATGDRRSFTFDIEGADRVVGRSPASIALRLLSNGNIECREFRTSPRGLSAAPVSLSEAVAYLTDGVHATIEYERN